MKYALFFTAVLSIASLADASSHNRILKKRSPAHFRRDIPDFRSQSNPGTGAGSGSPDGSANNNSNKGVINAGGDPKVASQDPASTTTGPASPTNTDTKETQTSTQGGLLDPIFNSITGTTSTTTSSLPPSSSVPISSAPLSSSVPLSSLPLSSSAKPSSTVPPPSSLGTVPTPTPQQEPVVPQQQQSTTTATITGPAEEAQTSPPAKVSGSVTTIQKNTIIVLAAIGGSIAAIALIWTIIRKWKFSPSSEFEDRMQPIDWQPTPDDGIVHRGRPTSHGSFTSSDSHHAENYNRHLRGQDFASDLPPHDLLSGSNHTGYADMHRGPSPQPQMSEGVHRGPSINRGYY
jgi:hypothetical protein